MAIHTIHIQMCQYYFAAKWRWKLCIKVRWKVFRTLSSSNWIFSHVQCALDSVEAAVVVKQLSVLGYFDSLCNKRLQ